MAENKTTNALLEITIGGGQNIGQWATMFKWRSFVNGGYIIYAKFFDPYLNILTDTANKQYLAKGRKEPLEVKFRLKYADGRQTQERIAYMTDLDSKIKNGGQDYGKFEFIAVDPPSWHLNNGEAAGKVYKGKISDVIKAVISEYAPGITPDVGETTDNKENYWQMMRLDPKTFIVSLMDWSASLTNKQTNWIVASVDKKIIIKEQAELESSDFGTYAVNTEGGGAEDVFHWEFLTNNYISNLQTVLSTAGISAVSGLYLDKKNNITKEKVVVKDKNTSNKKNVNIKDDQGFAKPTKDTQGWTMLQSVPEHNAGDVGKKYMDYIDGRIRNKFLNMLNMVMRMKIVVAGNDKVDDSSKLGVSTVRLMFQDLKNEPYILAGKWLVYGFEHNYRKGNNSEWHTEFYIARLDYDATAQKV